MKYERNNESSRKRVRYDNLRGLEKHRTQRAKQQHFRETAFIKSPFSGKTL